MSADINKTLESKRRTRRELQALPFEEKLRILERLREDLIIGLSHQRNRSADGAGELQPRAGSLLLQLITETLDRKPRSRAKHPRESEHELACEIERALADRQEAATLLKALFPNGIPATVEFYQRLNDLQMRLGWQDRSTSLIGSLLSLAMSQLTEANSETLLAELPRVGNPGFFQVLDYLSVLLRERELRPEFAAEWFPALVKRIGNDLASGGFWKALESYCEKHPANALEVLRRLVTANDEERISVAANMLGTLRSLELDSGLSSSFTAIDCEFSEATAPGPRAMYNRSWIQTAWRGKLRRTHLETLVARMSAGSAEEREQAFWIVCRLLLSPVIPSDCFDVGMEWLRSNTSPTIAPVAKYQVVSFAAQLRAECWKQAAELILAVQPVLAEHKGTWQRIEQFLVALLERDTSAFSDFFVKLARSNPENWLKVVRTARELEWLRSEMRRRDVAGAVGQLVFDETAECRKLGFFLFDDLQMATLPREILDQVDERRIALAFYELQRTSVHATAIARLLLLLLSCMERVHATLQRDFYDELVLQMKNYPAGCREEIQRHLGEFPILQKAVTEADAYFEQLNRVRESGMVEMEVAGYRQAKKLYNRRFARAVSKGAETMSVFMNMFKKVRLLYGRQWSTFNNGTLSERGDLQQVSSSMPIPRMEFLDPEGMSLRRLHASMRIRELGDSAEPSKSNA